jgi:anion-transporting  ArsA/GET3 family ATPase
MKKALTLLLIASMAGVALYAQDTNQEAYLELLKSDLGTQKVAIITEGMELTDAQSAVFWPIYRKYDAELRILNDNRLAVIKDYAKNFEQMTEAKAEELTNQTFAFFEGRIKLQKKYYKEFSKALAPILAAKYMQIERSINTLMDFQIMSQIPLVKR